jgi:hypothetical protein
MTAYTFRTMVVPASLVSLAQELAAGLSGDAGAGMWTTGLSPTGAAPATHYVSTGMIGTEFAGMLTDADTLYAACQAAGAAVTLEQCQALVTNSDVSEEAPFDAFARLGLKLVQSDTP